jgi:dienelactone hydrolase
MLKRLTFILAGLLLAAPIAQAAGPENVSFQTLHRDQTMLRGFLMKPAGDGPFPSILLLHGCGGLLTSKGAIAARERAWMNLFVAEGYVVLLVDSFNPRGFSSICTKGVRPLTAEKDRPYDAYAALGWLRERPYVIKDRIGIMGWSHGAMTTLATISQAMVQEIGWTAPGFTTAVAFYPGCLDLSKTRYAATVPLLMQLGDKDDWTPAQYCHRLARLVENGGTVIAVDTYRGAYHGFDEPSGTVHTRSTSNTGGTRTVHVGRDPEAAEKSLVRVKAWFAAALKNAPAASGNAAP